MNPLDDISISTYPNPFSESTKIILSIPNNSEVKIEVYEVQSTQPPIDGADVHHTVHGDLA